MFDTASRPRLSFCRTGSNTIAYRPMPCSAGMEPADQSIVDLSILAPPAGSDDGSDDRCIPVDATAGKPYAPRSEIRVTATRLPRPRRAAKLLATGVLLSAMTTVLHTTSAEALDNGVARTPPMGWNSWNTFGCNISEA